MITFGCDQPAVLAGLGKIDDRYRAFAMVG
jgi:hypothetical protein